MNGTGGEGGEKVLFNDTEIFDTMGGFSNVRNVGVGVSCKLSFNRVGHNPARSVTAKTWHLIW